MAKLNGKVNEFLKLQREAHGKYNAHELDLQFMTGNPPPTPIMEADYLHLNTKDEILIYNKDEIVGIIKGTNPTLTCSHMHHLLNIEYKQYPNIKNKDLQATYSVAKNELDKALANYIEIKALMESKEVKVQIQNSETAIEDKHKFKLIWLLVSTGTLIVLIPVILILLAYIK